MSHRALQTACYGHMGGPHHCEATVAYFRRQRDVTWSIPFAA